METLNELVGRYPALKNCSGDIERAREILVEIFDSGNKLMICGNGGSAADSDHIVGELSKGFLKKRPIPERDREKLKELYPDEWEKLADGLQCGLPAVSLHSQSALLTAFVNDVEPDMMYAQELYALGKDGDALIAISTSGNSKNVVNEMCIRDRDGTERRPAELPSYAVDRRKRVRSDSVCHSRRTDFEFLYVTFVMG